MRYRQIDLNLLLVFHELIQSGSVLRASRTLGVSQGAVSQSLAKLRRHFADELFIKTSTGVTPTVVALSIAEDVRESIAFAESALIGRTRFDPLESARTINICMGDIGEHRMLPKMLDVFRKIAPRCRTLILDLWGDELREGFERGEVDLAINARGQPFGDVLQQKLFEDHYVVLASKDSRLDREVDAESLAAAAHVAVSPGRLGPAHFDDELARFNIRRNVVVSVANWVTVPHILRSQPDLVAFIPSYLASAFPDAGLKTLKLAFDVPRVEIFQFWHRRSSSDPYNIWLRAQVREMFGRTASQITANTDNCSFEAA